MSFANYVLHKTGRLCSNVINVTPGIRTRFVDPRSSCLLGDDAKLKVARRVMPKHNQTQNFHSQDLARLRNDHQLQPALSTAKTGSAFEVMLYYVIQPIDSVQDNQRCIRLQVSMHVVKDQKLRYYTATLGKNDSFSSGNF